MCEWGVNADLEEDTFLYNYRTKKYQLSRKQNHTF